MHPTAMHDAISAPAIKDLFSSNIDISSYLAFYCYYYYYKIT